MKLHFTAAAALTLLVLVTLGGGAAYGITWEVGLKAGITNSMLAGDPVSAWLGAGEAELSGAINDSRIGFMGGGYARADFNDFFGIQGEILYKQKGGTGPSKGTAVVTPPNQVPLESTFDGTLTLAIDCIEMPVLAVFTLKPTEDRRLSLRGLVGPMFSYNAAAEMRLEGHANVPTLPLDEQNIVVDERKDASPQVKDFEAGALIGVSVSYTIGGIEMLLDARWGRGFTTIDNTANGRSTYTSGVDLMAGFEIPLGSR